MSYFWGGCRGNWSRSCQNVQPGMDSQMALLLSPMHSQCTYPKTLKVQAALWHDSLACTCPSPFVLSPRLLSWDSGSQWMSLLTFSLPSSKGAFSQPWEKLGSIITYYVTFLMKRGMGKSTNVFKRFPNAFEHHCICPYSPFSSGRSHICILKVVVMSHTWRPHWEYHTGNKPEPVPPQPRQAAQSWCLWSLPWHLAPVGTWAADFAAVPAVGRRSGKWTPLQVGCRIQSVPASARVFLLIL